MPRFITIIATAICFVVLSACATLPASSNIQPAQRLETSTMTGLAKRIDDYLAPLAATSDLSGTIRVDRDGEPPIILHYGYADWPHGAQHDNSTRYSAASVTKGVTAATLISLQRDGTLSLKDPVGLWLPSLANRPDVTILAVLRHRAGLPRDLPHSFDLSKDTVASWLSTHIEKIQPADKERYSNIGYALLAEVISAAEAKPFPQVARERILKPAGMGDSIIQLETADNFSGGALPYTAGPDPKGVQIPVPAPLEVGSSGLITTSSDLSRWARTLADGAYPELFVSKDPLGSIDIGTDDNGDYVSVQGTLPGYVANAIAWRDRDLTISYIGNLFSYPALNMSKILRSLVSEKPLIPSSIRPTAVELTAAHKALVGIYRHPDFGMIEIVHDEVRKGMFLKMPGQPAYWSFYLTPLEDAGLHWRAFGNILRARDNSFEATSQRLGQDDRVLSLTSQDSDTETVKE